MSLPAQIGRYQIVGHLASGGMAEILLGKLVGPSGFERPIVIKRILPSLAKRKSFRNMFLDEARIVARMQHPNVVHVHELGTQGDELFMAMEYLEGESLLSLLRRAANRKETIDRPLAAHIVAQACAGLHAAHELTDDDSNPLNLIHRDISPHNIFVTYAGAVKVLDFGIAKFEERASDTEAGQLKGKFPYMSPEQCVAKDVDRRSDLFSMGTVLFEITTGRRLFARETSMLTMQAITEGVVPSPRSIDPTYPVCLEKICMRALQREPRERYQTAADMRRDLVSAMRELAFDEVAEESLSRLMTYLFTDRVGEKKEMLRRVSAGSQITNVPAAEVDVSIELPAVFSAPHKVPPSTPFSTDVHTPAVPADKRRSWFTVLAVSVVLAAGIGIGFSLASPQDGHVEHAATASTPPPHAGATDPPTPEPVAPVAREPEPAAPPEPAPPETVTFAIRSTPSGATVRVDGDERGETPLELEMERGRTPVEVSIAAAGFRTFESDLRPTEDRTVDVALIESRSEPVSSERPVVHGEREPRSTNMATSMSTTMTTTMTTTMATTMDTSDSPFRRFN